MSYTYPEALNALESIAAQFLKMLRPNVYGKVAIKLDAVGGTASVMWNGGDVTIFLPTRPATAVMSQEEFEDWVSYVLHEMGHPTFTENSVWYDANRQGVARLTNAVEDVRMEKALIASGIVPNAKAVLSRLISRKVKEARFGGNWRPNARKDVAWTICVLGRVANGYAIDRGDVAWIKSQIVPGSTVDAVFAWALPEMAACNSTADCLALALKIAAAIAKPQGAPKPQGLPKPQGQPQPSQQPPQGDSEGDGDDAQGDDAQGDDAQGDDAQGDDAQGDDAQGDKGDDAQGDDAQSDKGDDAQGDDAQGDDAQGDDAQGDSDSGNDTSVGKGHGKPRASDEKPVTNEKQLGKHTLAPKAGDEITNQRDALSQQTIIDVLRDAAKGHGRHRKHNALGADARDTVAMRDLSARASRQRALLARALRATDTEDREGGRRTGRLSRHALTRAMAGAENVFERRSVTEGFDTDVAILLDASGSMQGPCLQAALETGLVIAQAAGSVGAACTTEIFNSGGYFRAGTIAAKRNPDAGEFSGLLHSAGGGTPLCPHMARMGIAQAKRAPGKRRVLFVVTDGDCDYGRDAVKGIADYLERHCGTVLAHVSIGSPLRGSFKAEVLVPHGVDISTVGLEHFVKVIQSI